MADPVVSFYENDSTAGGGTVMNAGNPLSFGSVSRGTTRVPGSDQSPLHVWNDKAGVCSSVDMESVRIGFTDASGGLTGEAINGTTLNGSEPFFEARSAGSSGCPDDAQTEWTRVGGTHYLDVGDIPSNSRRSIYVRAAVPVDASVGANALACRLIVDYTFEP